MVLEFGGSRFVMETGESGEAEELVSSLVDLLRLVEDIRYKEVEKPGPQAEAKEEPEAEEAEEAEISLQSGTNKSRVLRTLVEEPWQNRNQLADVLDLDRDQVSNILYTLRKQGLLERRRGEEDKRKLEYRPTEKGSKAL